MYYLYFLFKLNYTILIYSYNTRYSKSSVDLKKLLINTKVNITKLNQKQLTR